MKVYKLILRKNQGNPNHHIWKNHDVWWCNMTLHASDGTSSRHRFSLNTSSVEEARKRRDNIFLDVQLTL